jgi:hypothetical protein
MTTLVRFREPLRNVAMNGEFERLIKTILESPARAAALSNDACGGNERGCRARIALRRCPV